MRRRGTRAGPRAPPYDDGMLRVALRPRFLGLLALMVAATVVCGLLASWQWDRAHRALTSRDEGPARLGQIQDVTGVGDAVTNEVVGGIVTARGSFEADQQIVVPGRRIDGTDAVIVVTALHVAEPDGTTAVLPVARGWMPAAEALDEDGGVRADAIPSAPSGEVEVEGRLEASEAATGGIEDGVASEIATPMLVNAWGGPMYAGYVAQTSAADGLRPMPVATSEFRAGLDWQNLGYALQWVLFGAFFLYLWWRSVRTAHLDELADARERLQAELEEEERDGDADASSAGSEASADSGADPADGDPAAAAGDSAAGASDSSAGATGARDAEPQPASVPVGPHATSDPIDPPKDPRP